MKNNRSTILAREAVEQAIEHLDEDAAIGVGCSGGADSLALLIAVAKLYRADRAQQVHVVILEQYQREETVLVAERTARVAERFGFHAHLVTVPHDTDQPAKAARYAAFQEAIATHNLAAFLTGHTQSDQAEHVLLGMLRGAGTLDLAGLLPHDGKFIRPFVYHLSRKDTEQVCLENKMSYWKNPHTNQNALKYRRITIRRLMQDTEEYTRQSIVEPLARTAQLAAEDAEALSMYADIVYTNVVQSAWSLDTLKNIPKAIRKRVYAKHVEKLGVRSGTYDTVLLDAIDAHVLDLSNTKSVRFGNRLTVHRVEDRLCFETPDTRV